jgi:hypothetical protein
MVSKVSCRTTGKGSGILSPYGHTDAASCWMAAVAFCLGCVFCAWQIIVLHVCSYPWCTQILAAVCPVNLR